MPESCRSKGMALTTCPECGATVSTKAAACPACGHPIQERPSAGFVTLVLAILFSAAVIWGVASIIQAQAKSEKINAETDRLLGR